MNNFIDKLEDIISCLNQELDAVNSENFDELDFLLAKRIELSKIVYSQTELLKDKEVVERLLIIKDLQEELYDEVAQIKESHRTQLVGQRQQTKRLNAYRKIVQMGLE